MQEERHRHEERAAHRPERKAWWRYWLARAYAIVGVLWVIAPGFMPTEPFAAYWVIWAVFFFAPGVWMLVSLTAFPFRYSMFGPLRRTPPPKGRSSWFNELAGRIGLFGIGILGPNRWLAKHLGMGGFWWTSWRAYPEGLAVTITFFGSAFIHRDQLVSLRKARGAKWILEHASPELTKPIILYDEGLVSAVQSIMPPR